MSKKQNTKKKPEDYPLFNMRLSKVDKEKYTKFAKKYNLKLAGLVREGLKVIYKNPAFLNDLEDPYLAKIKEKLKGTPEYTKHIERDLKELKDDIKDIKDVLRLVARKQDLSQSELKKLNGKNDDSSEAVFE